MDTTAFSNAKQVEFQATIIRANGTREELGTISYWHKNPIKRLLWKIKQWLPY